MRPIGAFAHMMSSTVLVAPRTGIDTYGKPSYGDPVAYRAHIARETRRNLTADGQEIVDIMTIHLGSADAIQPTSLVTLSTADVGSTETFERQPKLVGVERRHDGVGAHHTVLRVGWARRGGGA